MMVLQATVKSYVRSSWQPTSTPNFFSPLSWIKVILGFPGCSEWGSQGRQLIRYAGVWGSSPAFLSLFWCTTPAPRAVMILLELSFLEHQTFKREEVDRYACGCKLVHNYSFLKRLGAAVMLTCVLLCLIMTPGPKAAFRWAPRDPQQPQGVPSKGKENVRMLRDPQAVVTWVGDGVSKPPRFPAHPVLACHCSFFHTVWGSWR